MSPQNRNSFPVVAFLVITASCTYFVKMDHVLQVCSSNQQFPIQIISNPTHWRSSEKYSEVLVLNNQNGMYKVAGIENRDEPGPKVWQADSLGVDGQDGGGKSGGKGGF